ncbi:MAG TPA: Crp/Fnr family transcriptional regulator [Candidatus Competibacteraceae bacterium]|nr:Crp/Fnr family transcriptional regulator [Candidatus Competibacteraceae bacterium]
MAQTSPLANVPLFAGLSPDELALLASLGLVKTYPKNAVLINEGEHSDTLYVVLSGQVKVYAGDEDGKEVVLSFLGPGSHFGELAILDNAPRSASVMTMESSRLMLIARQEFLRCLNQHPELAIKLLQNLAQRIRHLTAKVKNLALHDVYGRVARTLTQLASEAGQNGQIRQRLTQQNIADMVGASREMVSRILKELCVGGYIEIHDKHITLLKRLPSRW